MVDKILEYIIYTKDPPITPWCYFNEIKIQPIDHEQWGSYHTEDSGGYTYACNITINI